MSGPALPDGFANALTPRARAQRQAMAFLAAYDGQAGEDEQRVAQLARAWLAILAARQAIAPLVDGMIEDLYDHKRPAGGCGWEDLRRKFTQWAVAEEWTDPDDPRLRL